MSHRLRLLSIAVAALLLVTATPAEAATVRLASSLAGDTVATAVAWSQAKFPDAGSGASVVLGRSDSFADSLAAGSLSVRTNGPLLLNAPGDTLDQRVIDELERLDPTLVRIVGGTAAVSQAVQDRLEQLGYPTDRFAGINRIETAVAVAMDPIYSTTAEAYLARAFGDGTAAFADSLAGGMVAGSKGGPLLVTETATLSTADRDYFDALPNLDTVYVLGGTAAVSDAVVQQLQAMGLTVQRLAGANRYATAVAASERAFEDGPARITLVDGAATTSWASGFAGGFSGGALLLSNGEDVPRESQEALHDFGERQDDDHWLYCAPEVDSQACTEADALVHGATIIGVG